MDEPLTGMCFCCCDECKAKTHCAPCQSFLREQEQEYEFMKVANKALENEGEAI